MDKSSPVYENFAKKMEAMKGGPKISRSTMKIGGGIGLEKRVGNNEKKITLLKNIFKAQKQEIGEKITPKVSNLEVSLNETTQILGLITEKAIIVRNTDTINSSFPLFMHKMNKIGANLDFFN